MARSFNLSIIGAGNVAFSLSFALESSGNRILEVYSRDIAKGKNITSRLYEAVPTTNKDFSESKSDIFLICVPDDVIPEIIQNFKFPPNTIIAHTSGTVSLEAFSNLKNEKGVFYPVQTFTSNRQLDFSEVPIIIESPSVETEKTLTELALTLTKNIFYLNSERRKVLHLAAVFASNFVNNMLASSNQILENEQIPFRILRSLVIETVVKAMDNDPVSVQSGPAVRGDINTLTAHKQYLQSEPELLSIYEMVTENIIRLR